MRLVLALMIAGASACADAPADRGAATSSGETLAPSDERALLAAEAERRGYGERPEVRLAVRRAMVQALLEREVEEVVTPESIPLAAVEERFEQSERWNRPERRATAHVLARLPDDASAAAVRAAEEIARDAVAALRAADGDPAATAAAIAELRRAGREGVTIVAEDIPPMARDARLEEPYREAMFSLESEGVVPRPVRTSYGFHAVVVTDIEPAVAIPFEQAEPEVRAEIATERRAVRVNELLHALRDRHEVEVYEDRVREALARDFFEGS